MYCTCSIHSYHTTVTVCVIAILGCMQVFYSRVLMFLQKVYEYTALVYHDIMIILAYRDPFYFKKGNMLNSPFANLGTPFEYVTFPPLIPGPL